MKQEGVSDVSVPGLASVVIPCYNPGRYLAEAVASALAQSYRPVEVVVVDDGSTEDVRATATCCPGVRYLRQANRGVASARNAGARASRGEYLAFLDADDRLLPHALEEGCRELAARPGAAFAAGLCRMIGANGELLPFKQQPERRGDFYLAMLESNFIWMPAQVVYRRSAFEACGGFDEFLSPCADYDLYLRMLRGHSVVCHRRVVAEYRFHGGNMSGDPGLMLASALQALRRQWPHVRRTPALRDAYWNGRRFWRQYYGSILVEEIRAGIKTRDRRRRAIRGAAILLRYHPVEAVRQLGRKLRCTLTVRAGAR